MQHASWRETQVQTRRRRVIGSAWEPVLILVLILVPFPVLGEALVEPTEESLHVASVWLEMRARRYTWVRFERAGSKEMSVRWKIKAKQMRGGVEEEVDNVG